MNRPVPARETTTPTRIDGPARVEAFVQSEEARAAVQRIRHQLGQTAESAPRDGTLATAARMVGLAELGDLLIAELAEEQPVEGACAAIRAITAEGVALVLLGRQNDIQAYRRFTAAGASDYLVLPLDGPVDLRLGGDIARPAPAPGPRARSIAVCGVSGGVGASLLAANLAVALEPLQPATPEGSDPIGAVALLDADLVFGSQAVDFDVPPTTGLLDALLSPLRVDRTFLGTTMATPVARLSLFSAELNDMDELDRYRAGFPELVERLRQEFPTIVIDLPRADLAAHPEMLAGLDDLVLVLGPGFGSVRAFVRLMERLGSATDGPRIWTVLSQARRDAGLKPAEIVETLDRAIALELPYSGSDVARAQIKGQPLQRLAPRSAYARAVTRLAGQITSPDGPSTPRRSRFGRSRAKG